MQKCKPSEMNLPHFKKNDNQQTPVQQRSVSAVLCNRLCTPGMGVNLWGKSPLCVNPINVNIFSRLTKVLAEGKGVSVRKGLKVWSEA
jgi:hypothetical protein